MRENRPYGSEGGAARKGRLYPYLGADSHAKRESFRGVTIISQQNSLKPVLTSPAPRSIASIPKKFAPISITI
jgi:hypothetical protein